jgi:hypothetical protein
MRDRCKHCGASEEQHNRYAQAIGAKEIYSWKYGITLPVVQCDEFERDAKGEADGR